LSQRKSLSSAAQSPLKTLESDIKSGLKDFHIFENNGDIELSSIIVAKEGQKKGAGTKAINRLIAYADKTGQRIVLSPGLPNDSHGTTSRARLVKFYKRFGFVESKGRNIDFALGAGKMYRNPDKSKLSRADSSKPGMKINLVKNIANSIQKKYKGAFPLSIKVYATQDEAYGPGSREKMETVKVVF